ncbi:unnamed protein product, partial [Phaeothamnion confervicola]
VSALRPKKPVVQPLQASVQAVAKAMAENRTDACLIVDELGRVVGIMSDNDITRRVVGAGLDAATTPAEDVMTPKPLCVSVEDDALEALGTMCTKRFRHLPVVDGVGQIVGVLDLAKCLYNTMERLERA